MNNIYYKLLIKRVNYLFSIVSLYNVLVDILSQPLAPVKDILVLHQTINHHYRSMMP